MTRVGLGRSVQQEAWVKMQKMEEGERHREEKFHLGLTPGEPNDHASGKLNTLYAL